MIGGKVLDASAIAAYARNDLAAVTWIDVARTMNFALYLPTLALDEVRAVMPGAASALADLLDHPMALVHPLTAAAADQVERRLVDAGVFDGMAGHVAHACWPVGNGAVMGRKWAASAQVRTVSGGGVACPRGSGGGRG